MDEVLDRVELRDRARDRVGTYSMGMRQRLGIAASLLMRPRLLVLDEPANGLDPAGIRDMRDLVSTLPQQGVTVLYSSHLLAEVEEVCNRVAIVNEGRIAFEGSLDDLRASYGAAYRLETTDDERAPALVREHGAGEASRENGSIWFDADPASADAISIALGRARIPIRHLAREQRSLEELFLPADRAVRVKVLRAYEWETRKLVRQRRTWAGLLAAVLYALAFVITLSVKKNAGIPPDIPLAKQVTHSGVVLPLALLAFATFFGAPVISSLVAGDIVAAEDANNTLKMILTRSTGRGAIYLAKTLAAATYGVALMVVLFATSVIGRRSRGGWRVSGCSTVASRAVATPSLWSRSRSRGSLRSPA